MLKLYLLFAVMCLNEEKIKVIYYNYTIIIIVYIMFMLYVCAPMQRKQDFYLTYYF